MSDRDSFTSSNEFGLRGERFIRTFFGQCTGLSAQFITPAHREQKNEKKEDEAERSEDEEVIHVEGFDLYVQFIDENNKIEEGTVEVKTAKSNKLVSYGSKQNYSIPTIPIEIWANISNRYGGWFYELTHKTEFNDHHIGQDMYRANTPGAFIYLICGGDVPLAEQKPFICITFQNAEMFLDRLKQLANKKFGWDIDAWNIPGPENESYWKSLRPEVIIASKEKVPERPCNWNVPMSELEDLAYVVTISDPPNDLKGAQILRYEYYKKLAAGKHFDASEWYKMEQLEKEIHKLESETPEFDNAIYKEVMEKYEEHQKKPSE